REDVFVQPRGPRPLPAETGRDRLGQDPSGRRQAWTRSRFRQPRNAEAPGEQSPPRACAWGGPRARSVRREHDGRGRRSPRRLPGSRGQRPRPLQRRPQRLPAEAPPLDRGGGGGTPGGVASAVAGGRGAMSREGWRGLGALVRLASARPVVTVLLSVVLACAALVYTFSHLGFVTSGRDLLPQDRSYVQRDEEISDDLPRLDHLVVAAH